MYKEQLLNNIEKEINICRRLYTKTSADQIDFRPKEGLRSTLEILQYLSVIGIAMPLYWLKNDGSDFNTFYGATIADSKSIKYEQVLSYMDKEIAAIKELFGQITEEDLLNKEVAYPWGGTAPLGEAIIATSIKWLAAYKLQLFLFIKLSSDHILGTADAWMLTDMPV
ncbi:MAG: hypothetical protein ABI402_17780 [Ferruginibacter sp.]